MTAKLRPFMGIDGEGCGKNKHGQQHYRLLRAGPYELFDRGRPLSTAECLDFICDLPREPLLVGFSFGYDAAQILRDLDEERLRHIFADKPAGAGKSRYTYYNPDGRPGWGIEYIPRNYLRICRLRRLRRRIGPDAKWHTFLSPVPDSSRTIYETFGFFQMSFLKALQAFGIGREHWPMIEKNKDARAAFTRITAEIRHYNRLECELLAELMEAFRCDCHAAGMRPRTWNGAGKLAAYKLSEHGTLTADALFSLVPAGLLQMARDAYYGGRFEVTRIGVIIGPVYEYDLISAYPAAMRQLFCLLHGDWQPFGGAPPVDSIHLARVHFDHGDVPLCGLPIRTKEGRLYWPRQGNGTYWSYEIESAKRLGAQISYGGGWRYVRNCECQPFDWIGGLFAERQALGKDTRGYPVKLALNSLYGKLAQRIGNPRWGNMLWAGAITAITRAALNDAAAGNPAAVIMLATDALFTTAPLEVAEGDALGQWEVKQHPRLFVVQPGVYWGAARPKTRGIPAAILAAHKARFERAWRTYCRSGLAQYQGPPVVGVPIPLFIGPRLALARGKPETACRWIEERLPGGKINPEAVREYSFDWSRKRDAELIWDTGLSVGTRPLVGDVDLYTRPHRENLSHAFDLERLQFDDQPDFVDAGPP